MASKPKIDIDHLAHLANLHLSSTQKKQLGQDLNAIIDHINQIQSLDLTTIKDTPYTTTELNRFRPDRVTPSLTQKQATSGADRTHQGYFVVPAIIDHD